jgi:ribosome-associated toxin RatA of RatAB toxin-antitoxin module
MLRRHFLAQLAALAALASIAWAVPAAPRLRAVANVNRSIAFGTITIRAHVDVPVAPQAAWGVLTDYDRLAEFVPDMHQSRLISRPGDPPRVLQRGEKSWLLLDTPFEVILQMEETPASRIRFRQLSGTFKDMQGEWRLQHYKDWMRIAYFARMEPGLLSPRVPGDAWLIEADIQRMLEAIGQEMLRRQSAQARP